MTIILLLILVYYYLVFTKLSKFTDFPILIPFIKL